MPVNNQVIMNKYNIILIICMFLACGFKEQQRKYELIRTIDKKASKQTSLNQEDINGLDEPLKALAALYSSIAGSNCDGANCDLTTALNLGKQTSEEHINIIKKWFPNDKIAQILLRQNCDLPFAGSSYFREYAYLNFDIKNDTVVVHYEIITYDHGKSSVLKNFDKWFITPNEIFVIKQNIWKFRSK